MLRRVDIAVLVGILEPGRKRRPKQTNVLWLWSLAFLLALLLLVALLFR
jgi:hypothetical protein